CRDKVDPAVPSPLGGKLVEMKAQEGETGQVGPELAMIDSGGDGQAGDGQAAEAPPKERADEAPEGQAEEEGGAEAGAEAEPKASGKAEEATDEDRQGERSAE